MANGGLHSKRQRVSKACEQCRRKKVKCDGALPVCNNCISLNIDCVYKESTKKRGPPKGYIEAIEGRLHRLEALLGSVAQDDDPRFQAIVAELNAPLETAYGELVRPRPVQRPVIPDLGSDPGEDSSTLSKSIRPDASATTDNVNDTLDNLSIDDSGQLRYYGKSSGFYMLRGIKNFQHSSLHFNSSDSRARRTSSKLLSVDPMEMPPEDLSNHLLDLYFSYFYPLLPVLHKRSFMTRLASKDNRPSRLLLNSIYALASRVSSDVRVRAEPQQHDTAGDVFFERARLLLDLEWDDFQVCTVQSLLLLSSHQNGALKTVRGWLYSGMAFRMAQNLGLHRNCDTWDLTDTEKEERKRTFYCCFVVDRLICAMHGRSPMIDERDYDTPYPTENDEDDVDRLPRVMDNFQQLIKLCEHLGDVLRDLYMVKGRRQLSMMSCPDSVVSTLDKGLNKWMAKLAPSLQYRPPRARFAERAPAPSLEKCQMHMLFYTTLILLHRPFIPGPGAAASSSVFPSASICTFAANKILDIVESLMAENLLQNVNHYSLYYMFTAGIIFIYNAASTDTMFAFEAKVSINTIMRAMGEVEKTWITSARHCNILGALAGLRDINLECVDEGHTRSSLESRARSNEESEALTLSTAVPSSPEPAHSSGSEPFFSPEEKHVRYYQLGVSPANQNATSPEPPHFFQPPATSPPLQPLHPSMIPPTFSTTPPNPPFDPNSTAFWGMPTSFDVDEWNSYFSNQAQKSQ